MYGPLSATWRSGAARLMPQLLGPFLSREGVSVFAGETGVGKSLLLMDMVLSQLARHPEWHGLEVNRWPRGDALIINGEGSRELFESRAGGWLVSRQADDALLDRLCVVSQLEFTLGQGLLLETVVRWQERHIEQGGNAFSIVAVDNLAQLSGADDANSQAQLRIVMQELVEVEEHMRCPVILMAHPNKVAVDRLKYEMERGEVPMATQAVSGSAYVVQVATSVNVLVKDGQGGFYMANVKSRAREQDLQVYRGMLEKVDLGFLAEDGDPAMGAAVAMGDWGQVQRKAEAFAEFVAWLALRDWTTYEDVEDEDNGCPVKKGTVQRYVRSEEFEDRRRAYNIEVREEGTGRRPRVLFRISPEPAPYEEDAG